MSFHRISDPSKIALRHLNNRLVKPEIERKGYKRMSFENIGLGVFLIKQNLIEDRHGKFFQLWNHFTYSRIFHNQRFPYDFVRECERGHICAPSWQLHPFAQARLVSVIKGSALHVAVDVKHQSKNFGKWVKRILEPGEQLYIPLCLAHGFQSLAKESIIHVKCTNLYDETSEQSFLWCDPEVHIEWNRIDEFYISEKDKTAPKLKDIDTSLLF